MQSGDLEYPDAQGARVLMPGCVIAPWWVRSARVSIWATAAATSTARSPPPRRDPSRSGSGTRIGLQSIYPQGHDIPMDLIVTP